MNSYTYEEALSNLHLARGLGKKDGIKGITRLASLLGNPQKDLKFVHVVGTNGKGSVSTMLASVLKQAGVKTGLYISPFVDDFKERMQVDGAWLDEAKFAACYAEMAAVIPQILAEGGNSPTEFEQLTAVAFLYFKRMDCKIVVLEAGIGGLNDATNVIDPPELVVITPISLDHTDVLGDTVSLIAEQKCGVIKPGTRVITCPNQAEEAVATIRQTCNSLGVCLTEPKHPPEKSFSCTLTGEELTYKGLHLHIPLLGKHQIQNAVTVFEAALALGERGFAISAQNIEYGIASARFNGRLEVISRKPLFLVDGSHNPAGVNSLAAYLDTVLGAHRKILVVGMLKDKNTEACIPVLAQRADVFIAVAADTFRTLPAEETAKQATGFCSDIRVASSMEEALSLALAAYNEGSCIMVCGSLFLPGEAKRVFGEIYKKRVIREINK